MKQLLGLLLLIPLYGHSQELYIHTEPASTIPKHVLGIRLEGTRYDEAGTTRNWTALTAMYGVGARFTASLTASSSNHHGENLPPELFSEDGGTAPVHSHNTIGGKEYSTRFEGLSLYGRYRFHTDDGEKKHFRMAAYARLAWAQTPHDEAEPDLMGDNSGVGAGLVATQLIRRLALSANLGFIVPFSYTDDVSDGVIRSGDALTYALSAGYQLFPLKLKNYNQPGLNFYCELLGKNYTGVTLTQDGKEVDITGADALQAGKIVDVRPGVQLILFSNTRIDFSMAWKVAGETYTKTYPEYFLKLQHYFFLH